MDRSANLLDEALGIDDAGSPSGRVVLIEDCVETSGAFVLHHLIKRSLSPRSSGVVIFVAFAQPFSHYDRILRKMGCNLVVQRDNNRFVFLDMLTLESPDGDKGKTCKGGLFELFGKIQKIVEVSVTGGKRSITIMTDDISIMEVAANGSSNYVLEFLHYSQTLTTEFGCSLVILNHQDIYSTTEGPTLILQMEYLAEVIIRAEPLATGLATDVHGQDECFLQGDLRKFMHNIGGQCAGHDKFALQKVLAGWMSTKQEGLGSHTLIRVPSGQHRFFTHLEESVYQRIVMRHELHSFS